MPFLRQKINTLCDIRVNMICITEAPVGMTVYGSRWGYKLRERPPLFLKTSPQQEIYYLICSLRVPIAIRLHFSDSTPMMADQPKPIISTSVAAVLQWHIWTIVLVSGTIVLLYLNFSKFSISGELGGSASSTANYLGILQLAVKAHELAIVASLAAIAQQCILQDLLDGGLLLGLMGADGAIGNPSFLISRRFRLAVKFGFRRISSPGSRNDNADHLRTLRLVILIIPCCVIAGLAGPASAVLMIPRVDWFYVSTDQFEAVARSTLPTVMIGTSPGLLDADAFMESNVFAIPNMIVDSGFRYWKDISGDIRIHNIRLQERSRHQFRDYYGQVYVNTSGSDQRPLDGAWTGGTTVNYDMYSGDRDYSLPLNISRKWTDVKAIHTTNGFVASVTCRAAMKIPCTADSTLAGNLSYPDWCYRNVRMDNGIGEVRISRNLLMAQDFVEGLPEPRIWLTEGPRIAENQHYSDSIEVLFEKRPDELESQYDLTICSLSAILVAAVATSYGTFNFDEKVEYLDHVFLPDGTSAPPRKFLFHENWLDRAYSYDPDLWLSQSFLHPASINQTLFDVGSPYPVVQYAYPTGSMVYPDNFTYPARPGLAPRMNSFGSLGASLIHAVGYPAMDISEAFPVEAIVGGALTYLLSWSLPSYSQYSMPYDQIPEAFRLGPPESFSHPYTVELFRRGYGFQLSSRTGYLGVAVLVSHAVIVIAASLWRIVKGRPVIHAWSTVPDYVCLGSGSSSLVVTHRNTCAGVAGEAALTGMVKVGESGHLGSTPHLEIFSAVDDSWTAAAVAVDLRDEKKRYGFVGGKLKAE